jgi:hypothetical protein
MSLKTIFAYADTAVTNGSWTVQFSKNGGAVIASCSFSSGNTCTGTAGSATAFNAGDRATITWVSAGAGSNVPATTLGSVGLAP